MNLLTKNLVEAAGVEPASEKARHVKNYVCIRFWYFSGALYHRQERTPPSPIDLDLLLRTEALDLSCKMTSTSWRASSPAGAAT
jgi:hypothetical protein